MAGVRHSGPGAAGVATLARPVVLRRRMGLLAVAILAAFTIVGGQLTRLALRAGSAPTSHVARVIARSWARPDIVDRNGRLLATDLATPSLFADPSRIDDPDAVILLLREILPGLDEKTVLERLRKKNKKFVWIERGLKPATAQAIHDLGIPGLRFRTELRRVYPVGKVASHVLGTVNIDNRGQAGIERYIDDIVGVEAVDGPGRSAKPPLRLTIDLGAQYAVREELMAAMKRYRARGAAGIVLDVVTGEVLAASSLPEPDPNLGGADAGDARINRLLRGRYELGSVFKAVTLAAAFDLGAATPGSRIDTRGPITYGRFTIRDSHPINGTQTLADVFLHSSNIGAARLATAIGTKRFRGFLERIGLGEELSTEAGRIAPPRLPKRWSPLHTMTISFGHGIAVAPLQFAAAAATLVNGGHRVYPTFVAATAERLRYQRRPVLKDETSGYLRGLLRLNVTSPKGTGRRADVPGYDVGGKTGTADIARNGGYDGNGVIASFLAVFPSAEPRYLTLVSLFDPQRTPQSGNSVAAGRTAAPTTARIISRIAPILGLLPRRLKSDS